MEFVPGMRAPAGAWFWHLEGPGWIGLVPRPEQIAAGTASIVLAAEAVPACLVQLHGADAAASSSRLDVYSETWDALYAIDLRQRREFQVPRGRFGIVFREGSEVRAIAAPFECDGKRTVEVQLQKSLAAGTESTLVRLQLPLEVAVGGPVETVMRELGTAGLRNVVEDSLRVRTRGNQFLFFTDRPARPAELLVSGAEIKSLRELLPEMERGVREVELRLTPRAVLTVHTDLRSLRRHAQARLSLLRCHDSPLDRYALDQLVGRGECSQVAESPIAEGLRKHRFEQLDAGTYVLSAQIDEERIDSSEFGYTPLISADDVDMELPEPWSLQEMEIHGQLLESGAPVPGMVRVSGHGSDRLEYQEFATDDDLTYHWYFIGRPFRQRGDFRLRSSADDGRLEGSVAAEPWTRVQACVELGGCFVVASEGYFVGGGRFDIELPATPPIELLVLDADTGMPIPQAKVLILGRRHNLAFDHGVIERVDAPGFRDELWADANGRATIRVPHEPDLAVLVARREYEPHRLDLVQAWAAGGEQIVVHLKPKRDEPGGTEIRNARGEPVAGAQVVVVGPDGDWLRVHCSERTNSRGMLRAPPECQLDDALGVLVVHRSLGTHRIRPAALVGQSVLQLAPGSGAVVLRAQAPDGTAAAARRVWLGLDGRPMPAELYWLLRAEGRLPHLVTDSRGELVIPALGGDEDWYVTISDATGREYGPMLQVRVEAGRPSIRTVVVDN